ncbi:MAG: hypothetical protein ACYDBH_22965, partial [Acidobacteriaceae bacterium]
MSTLNPFSAADSALGYLYQVRVALLLSLRRLKSGSDFVISLEVLDDVAFVTAEGTPQEVLQTKHHLDGRASLTDASTDLWKTLRVWFEMSAAGTISSNTALHLLTTAQCPDGSIASCLRNVNRDVEAALGKLVATAQT